MDTFVSMMGSTVGKYSVCILPLDDNKNQGSYLGPRGAILKSDNYFLFDQSQ